MKKIEERLKQLELRDGKQTVDEDPSSIQPSTRSDNLPIVDPKSITFLENVSQIFLKNSTRPNGYLNQPCKAAPRLLPVLIHIGKRIRAL
ncbi:hypothetical protein IFM89_002769 [Coptis chinensis]|uniref:Uncharacterized protein n=1 Tax=Coptis chinensis TaxID=261450 RepID=A0A835HRG0_9MAGN|nr:hypothetical protein IFM89_002769 [Coptis chinensis]